MLPLLRTTLGRKGHRPVMGHLDGHDLRYLFGALSLVTGQLTTRLVEKPRVSAQSKQSHSGQRCLPEGVARPWREIARAYAAAHYPRVVRVIDHAPWHRSRGYRTLGEEGSDTRAWWLADGSAAGVRVAEESGKALGTQRFDHWRGGEELWKGSC
jgi:hypothetical protein